MHERGIVFVIVLGAALLLVACQPVESTAATPESALVPLIGTEWLLNEMQGEHLMHEEAVTAQFGDDGKLEGVAGCNDYTTRYQTEGNAMTIDPDFDAGVNVCGEAIMAVESAYLASLQRVGAYEIEQAVLLLRDDDGTVMLVYNAKTD